MRVIVTGSRRWGDKSIIYSALTSTVRSEGTFTLCHGACSTGTDQIADEWYDFIGKEYGCEIVRYPALWAQHGATAGPKRNKRMVDHCLLTGDRLLLLAFPHDDGTDTQHCMGYAMQSGIEVRTFSEWQTT